MLNANFSLPFPWQQSQWTHLFSLCQTDRLPHALLFTGQAGLGKYHFAIHFAHSLLCQTRVASTGQACQHCRDCLLTQAHTHPDLTLLTPEKIGAGIKIDPIRASLQYIDHTSTANYKIIIIHPADSLLIAASNALLKHLEEPTARSLFILVTDKPALLLPTIRSRCQTLAFYPPTPTEGKRWLREQLPAVASFDELYDLAEGAPLQVLDYAQNERLELYQKILTGLQQILQRQQDPIALAESFIKVEFLTVLDCLLRISHQLLKCQLIQQVHTAASMKGLKSLANLVSTRFLLAFFDKLTILQQRAKLNLNPQLQLEDLFCVWMAQEVVVESHK